ncbi:hypothetical protein JCM19240_70 [Vibrio maritimus]|uniref:DUF4124 domain-containing protein n=1 Tax=Vibrio maritimus TaxID=990268 RepID=A0A090TD75_9VIBR|nr:hypothetical protein JCM19240_70 [Vibrio maritimus]
MIAARCIFPTLAGLFVLVSGPIFATDIYHWKDEQGNIHFSDFPDSQNAKVLSLPDIPPPPQVLNEAPVNWTSSPYLEQNQTDTKLTVAIASPQHDATLRNNSGDFSVSASLKGSLSEEQTLQLLLDGKSYGSSQTTTSWRLTNIDRGTHTLTIQVQQSGKVIASSDTITVHLHRASVQ